MNKWLIFLVCPILASAGMNISTNERVSTILKPDVLRGSLSFEEISKNQNTIKEHLNTIVAEVKKIDPNGTYCRGGGYNLSPRYSYKDQKQEFIGYSGNLYFGCDFTSIDQYNAMSASIEKVTASAVHKNQSALEWSVSDKNMRESQNALRADMLEKTSEQAMVLSKATKMMCEVATVNFGGSSSAVRPMMVKSMVMVDSVATQSPIQSEEESVLEATVEYRCFK